MLLDISFLLVYFLTPILYYFLLRMAKESIFKISLVNIIFISLFLFSYLGLLPLYFQFESYRVEMGVESKQIVFTVLICSIVCMFFFIIAVIFVRDVLKLRPLPFEISEIRELYKLELLIMFVFFVVSCIFLFLYLSKVDYIALFLALDGKDAASQLARSNMTNNFPGKYHWYKLIMNDLARFFLFSFFAAWLIKKNTIFFTLFFLMLIYSLFVSLMTAEKSPFVWLVIGLYLVFALIKYNGLVPKKSVLIVVSLILVALAILHVYVAGANSIFKGFSLLFSRAFTGTITPAYFYLEFFPEHMPFLFGKTFPNPGGILPYEPVQYTVELMNWRFPEHLESGVVGTMPTVFWAEAYANFGFYGIPIISFLVGVFVATISWLYSKVEISPITIGYFVWVVLIFRNLSVTGFSEYILNLYLIAVTIVFLALQFSKGKLVVRIYNPNHELSKN
ncbi:oligosaccharide repeat unit polymerase [bacterium]|nr:oligosaccharide repeat unit polymerase [bacterium]